MSNEKNMLDALIQHQVYSFRASTKVVNELQDEFGKSSNAIVSRLRDLLDELTQAEKDALVGGKYTTDALKEVKDVFDELYTAIAKTMPDILIISSVALATYESSYIAKLYGGDVDSDKIGKSISKRLTKKPVINGMKISDIWRDLAENIRKQAIYSTIDGIDKGLTTDDILKAVRGVRTKGVDGKYSYIGGVIDTEKRKSDIESNVRTIRSIVANRTYDKTFEALGFDYRKILATLDGRTCNVCASRDGDVHKASEFTNPPPWHRRSRTIAIGCDKDGNLSGKRPFVADNRPVRKIPMDERDGKIGQIDANTTYPEWFKRQDAEFQKEVLGKTKYELYKNGGFTFDKFIDPLGKQYTIAELKLLDAETFKRLGL